MKLVPNARQSWRWFSVQAMTVAAALQGAWMAVPDDLKARAPDDLANALTVVILALGVIGRLVPQGGDNA